MLSPEEIRRQRQALEQRREKKRREARRRLVLYLVLGLLAAAVMAVTALFTYQRAVPVLGSESSDGRGATGQPLTILVLGVDDGIGQERGRADTILLTSIYRAPDGQPRVGVLSIPRDTWVRIPGRERYDRINAAYAYGGAELAVATVESLVGVDVRYSVRIGLKGFAQLIDALGGVEITVEKPMRYHDEAQGLHIDLEAGHQRLTGAQALGYVRYRSDGLGDVSYDPFADSYAGRLSRQQKFLRALAQSLEELRGPTAISKSFRLAWTVLRAVETDMGLWTAMQLAPIALQLSPDRLSTALLPGSAQTIGGASYWVVNGARMADTVRQVLGVVPGPEAQGLAGRGGETGAAAFSAARVGAEEGVNGQAAAGVLQGGAGG